jgi:hypothetical protein
MPDSKELPPVKFHLLPVGHAFSWRGQVLSKSGPVTAVNAAGKSIMVPRSATVEPVAGTEHSASAAKTGQSRLAAFAQFAGALRASIDNLEDLLQPDEMASLRADIQRLLEDFQHRLEAPEDDAGNRRSVPPG